MSTTQELIEQLRKGTAGLSLFEIEALWGEAATALSATEKERNLTGARFFIDHGQIHDRVTGKHVTTDEDSVFCDGINSALELLNGLDASVRTAAARISELEAAETLIAEYLTVITRQAAELDALRGKLAGVDELSETAILAAADAAEIASCPGREGPYGLYDYSNYAGTEEPHVIRDFRTLKKGEYGATVARFATRKAAEAEYMRLQKLHVMGAAIAAYLAAVSAKG